MALTECLECCGKVSTTAAFCPHCGFRSTQRRQPSRIARVPARIKALGILLALFPLMYLFSDFWFFICLAGLASAITVVLRARSNSRA